MCVFCGSPLFQKTLFGYFRSYFDKIYREVRDNYLNFKQCNTFFIKKKIINTWEKKERKILDFGRNPIWSHISRHPPGFSAWSTLVYCLHPPGCIANCHGLWFIATKIYHHCYSHHPILLRSSPGCKKTSLNNKFCNNIIDPIPFTFNYD